MVGVQVFVLKGFRSQGFRSHKQYMDAFKAVRLNVTDDPDGLDRRGLYIGQKVPLDKRYRRP